MNVQSQISLTDTFIFELPGQGEAKDYCQDYIYKAHPAADGEWHAQKFQADCGRFECPVCPGWRKTESMSVFDRLVTYKERTGRAIAHYVVSPRPELIYTPGQYKKMRKEMYKIAKQSGVKGGVAIFHYYRHPSTYNEERETVEPHNPHWHILGDGWVRPPDSEKWITKNIGIRRSYAQIMSTVKYCLKWASKGILLIGDSSIQKKTKIEIETWFGTMSLKALKLEKIHGDGVKCEVCNEMIPVKDWIRVNFTGYDPPSDSFVLPPGTFELVLPYE